MKTIGLLGGMSWESTALYYRMINEAVATALGGLHSARIILYSVDFAEIESLQREGRWPESARLLADAATALEDAGADVLALCTNTMHKVAPEIESYIDVPLLHIADPTGEAICAGEYTAVGLLGTRFTMEQDFYRGRLHDKYGLRVIVPRASSRELVHDVIYSELCRGVVSGSSRSRFAGVVSELEAAGAEAIVLGCTEVGLLLRQDDIDLPLFDTTLLHAEALAAFSLGGRSPL
jgi:aspartate racemase